MPQPAQQLLQEMVQSALVAADPYQIVKQTLSDYEPPSENVYLVSVGKASVAMAQAAYDLLTDQIVAGLVISKLDSTDLPIQVAHYQGNHPIPGPDSIAGTKAIRDMLSNTHSGDQVLALISGGTSALLTNPSLPLPQWQALNKALIECGCTINEINHIRQHFDDVKGGGLLRWAAPAPCRAYILSDVIGNRIEHIGSGPTVPVTRDLEQVHTILDTYNVWDRLGGETQNAMRHHLNTLANADEPSYPAAHNEIIGDVRYSAEAAAEVARKDGYKTEVVATDLTGEAADVARELVEKAKAIPPGTCHIYGGETTVTIREGSTGIGGRNQELALAAAIALAGASDVWLVTLATDGEDGPTDAAGAFVSGETVKQAKTKGLDPSAYLQNHDSFGFFSALDENHLRIGPTGTNVNDLVFILKTSERDFALS